MANIPTCSCPANQSHVIHFYRAGHGNQFVVSVEAWDNGVVGYCYLIDEEETYFDGIEQVIRDVAQIIDDDPDFDRNRQWKIYGIDSVVKNYVTRYLGPLAN